MLLPPEAVRFDNLSVAVPTFIRHPTLRKLAERVQHETLNALTSPAMYEAHNTSYSARVLDSLYQTPIADASILVAITHERRPKLLLTRRAAHMNSHAGEVSCAGGKYEIGDGNNVVTALREACEETALPPNKVQLLGQLPIQTSKSGMSVRPIVALIAPDLLLVPEAGEISRIFWADLELLVTQPTVEYEIEYKMQEQTATILTPSWQVDGETVWGLTGRVIANLLETGFDRQLEWYYRVENKR
ncbi:MULTISPECIES: CoA pyrophosphatase [unclassified Psychrobacter]|uniref:NUDIX hydrolase n=1 Tax=unclassified Psychrobacter TaxID=196806 RepID=UPI0025B29C12|nr:MULTISPECIES: CoA pyrophosphatase [unclassified Psychrobacter]MDN3453083.1 CoA pyrophosphatase [Psychrobacter sp. APC 3350]MDN3502886.1 CoA pyrophosphatase [Psychrobacter sp. 5A.1]